jgi:hypothetical protein
MSTESMIAILEALNELDTELYKANRNKDRLAMIDVSQRITNVLRCLPIPELIEVLKSEASKENEAA